MVPTTTRWALLASAPGRLRSGIATLSHAVGMHLQAVVLRRHGAERVESAKLTLKEVSGR